MKHKTDMEYPALKESAERCNFYLKIKFIVFPFFMGFVHKLRQLRREISHKSPAIAEASPSSSLLDGSSACIHTMAPALWVFGVRRNMINEI